MGADSVRVVEWRRRLDPRPESARLARQLVLEALTDVGRSDLVDVVGLLVSELVTNAIVHARTPIDLEVVAGPVGVRVAVHDGSPNQPTPRHYGASATTGRGLELVELLSDRHGTDADPGSETGGKTVWFELGEGRAGTTDPPPTPWPTDGTAELTVHLIGLPVLLARAWQQHADALLRELLLSRWDDEGTGAAASAGDDGAANDAFTAVASALEALGPPAALPARVDVVLPMRHETAAHFADLDAVMDHVTGLAEQGLTLAPATLPEIRLLRRWICGQVSDQAAGRPPGAWPGIPEQSSAPTRAAVEWDATEVEASNEAVVAGDDGNRIIAASPSAMRLLGWDDDLIGQRLLALIPLRFRDAHIASFTLQLLTGETTILGREITVPALRRDGSEVEVRLLVQRVNVADGRAVFTARMRSL